MSLIILMLPILGFSLASFFGRFLGKGSCYIIFLNIFFSSFLSFLFYYKTICLESSFYIVLSPWIYSDLLKIDWGFQFDSLTITMLCVVTFVSFLVHLFSLEYMESDPHLIRFISYLSLFTFLMLILVTADNFAQMFVGWEGVGLSSYLLINFWYTRIQANKAAIKAMLVNRIGDFAILLGMFLIYFVFDSLNFAVVFSLTEKIKNQLINSYLSYIDLITLMLFMGAMGKSAQLGLHVWLPDAMEGPTPVSALIHAATMVTAGVFLIVRCSFLFETSIFTLNVILLVGSLTTFFSSTIGLFQNDIKKIIAYSTCSQLGYMIFVCGLSSYDVAMFHLSNHAFFKALLFLAAGSIIHSLNDEQDLRKFGGLKLRLPLEYVVVITGSLALMGFPFLAGFYSKDTILELSYAKYSIFSHFSYYLGTFSVFSTSFYSIRLLYLVFLSEPNGPRENILKSEESGFKMQFPLYFLFFLSIFIGFITKDLFIGFGTSFWKNSILIKPQDYYLVDIEFIDLLPKSLPLILTFIGAMIAFLIYAFFNKKYYYLKKIKNFKIFYTFLNRRWYFDKIYNETLSQNILSSGFSFFYKDIDRGLLEYFGPYGLVNLILKGVKRIIYLQKGSVSHNLFLFLILLLFSFFFIVFFGLFYFFFEILFLFLTINLLR